VCLQEKDRIIAEFVKEREASMAAQDAAKKQRQAKLADRLAAKKAKSKGADGGAAAGPPPDGAPPDALRAAAAAVASSGGPSADDDTEEEAAAGAGKAISRRPSRKASIRAPADMDSAAKAAAAAAASPALVSSMALIERKLEKIEEMMLAIERNRGGDGANAASNDGAVAAAAGAGGAGAGAAGATVYHDEAEPSPGHALDIVPDDALKDQEKVRLDFGRRLAELVGLRDVRVRVAEELPPSAVVNNAFSNSYHFDAARGELLVHRTRVPKAGDFGLVMIHALSHIKVRVLSLSTYIYIGPICIYMYM